MATRITTRSRKAIIEKAFIDYNAFIGEETYNPTYIAMVVGDIERTAAEQEQRDFEARAIEEQEAIEVTMIDTPKAKAKAKKKSTASMDKATLWAKHSNIPRRKGVPGSDLNPARGIYLNYLKESNARSIWSLKRFWREATDEQRTDALGALGATSSEVEGKITAWEKNFHTQKANK